MPVNIVRLRKWLAAATIFMVLIVAGVYLYGRWQVYRAVLDIPRKLGVDIQQNTEGFTLSKSEGGRTLFTIHASNVQYKRGGRAELRKVQIIVYGRDASRFDQIYGEQFQYDPDSGNVAALGEVQIDLEANARGPNTPDQSTPEELKNPIHLKTSGLVFNQKSGIASTDKRIEVRTAQANGSAEGATYNSRDATLILKADVQLQGSGSASATIKAQRATVRQRSHQAVLEGVHIQRAAEELRSDRLTVFFRDDNSVERLVALGGVEAKSGGTSHVSARSPRADAWITEKSSLRSAMFSGGVSLASSGSQNLTASAGRVNLEFSGKSVLDQVIARDNVHLVQLPANGTSARGQAVDIAASRVNFEIGEGRVLERAVTSGASQIMVLESSGAGARTVATAGQFTAEFDRGRLSRVVGSPNTKVVETRPGKQDQVTSSDKLEVTFNPTGGIQGLVESGNFEYREGPNLASAKNVALSQVARSAFAHEASFDPIQDTLLLTGSPRVVQAGISTSAQRIRIMRRAGEAIAEGDVKTTYSELRQQPGGALLATADPIHVTAATMTAKQAGGVAEYTGSNAQSKSSARLWQGANVIQAPVIEFNRDKRTVIASSSAGLNNETTSGSVSTVLVQQEKSGKTTPVTISSAHLSYVDSERRLRFEGGVVIKSADTRVTARQVEVLLQPKGQPNASRRTEPLSAPSQIDRIVASGGVTVQEAQRRADGENLVYTAEDARFVLTGGSPSIFDAEHGRITGDSLTFFSRDGRVLVEGNSSPTVTQTRVAK